MALINPAVDPTDGIAVAAAYWKYTYFSIDVDARTVDVRFGVWRSAAARLAGHLPMFTQSYQIDPGSSPSWDDLMASDNSNPAGIGSTIYGVAKSLPQFADAEDA